MDIEKLKELCNKYTVEVNFNGLDGFKHKVIDAEKLLKEIHTTSELDKETFIKNINSEKFMTPEYENIFRSIKLYGIFKIKGHEAITGKGYITVKTLIGYNFY